MQSWYAGLVLGTCQFILTSKEALGFWHAGKLRQQGFNLRGNHEKNWAYYSRCWKHEFSIAKSVDAMKSVFVILDKNSSINPKDIGGIKPDKIDGTIELRNVDLSYPACPNVIVLKNFCLEIKAGSSMALVGKSVCGKFSIIGLLERFYDPIKGLVLIDNKDIKAFNLRYLRCFIGLGARATLSARSFGDNIRYGKEDATEAEMLEAVMTANAHGFI
ncbi:hypothetical protein SUGI_0137900 [Cryptomeria japonica]|nr:hypothetical protein SUGI_0137900 [Cryptomeria japonica]